MSAFLVLPYCHHDGWTRWATGEGTKLPNASQEALKGSEQDRFFLAQAAMSGQCCTGEKQPHYPDVVTATLLSAPSDSTQFSEDRQTAGSLMCICEL